MTDHHDYEKYVLDYALPQVYANDDTLLAFRKAVCNRFNRDLTEDAQKLAPESPLLDSLVWALQAKIDDRPTSKQLLDKASSVVKHRPLHGAENSFLRLSKEPRYQTTPYNVNRRVLPEEMGTCSGDLVVRYLDSVSGLGVFATKRYTKGDLLTPYEGEVRLPIQSHTFSVYSISN